MKSKANIKGHPLHPILIVFPTAFFNGVLLFDIMGLITDNSTYHTTALHLLVAGLLVAPVAAVPGLIDLVYTVPPDSTGRKRGIKHALTNVTMLVVFAVALYLRLKNDSLPLPVVGLEAAGAGLLAVAGWMGGTLVTRNQISIDPRYAHAGKWKDQTVKVKDGRALVAITTELKVNQMKLVRFSGKRIVIARTEKGFVAFADHCTHRGGSLAGGSLICSTVQCPWHGSQFDVHTGEVKAGPAKEKIVTYDLSEENGKLFLNGV